MIRKVMLTIAFGLFLLLNYYAFRYSQVNLSVYSEILTDTKDSEILNMFLFLLLVLIIGFLSNKCKGFGRKFEVILLIFVNAFAMIFCVYLLYCNAFTPIGDQEGIITVAQQFQNGDYSHMFPNGGYIGKNPHQLGLVTFFRIIYLVTGSFDFLYFQYWNILMLPVLILSSYYIVKKLAGEKRQACYAFLMLIFTCIPMYGYVPYVYGEITSTALTLCSVAIMFRAIEKFKWYKVLAVGITIAIAVQFRQNVLIAVIAMGIVLVLNFFLRKDKKALLLLLSVIAFTYLLQFSVNKLYEPYEYTDDYGMPASTYIAMGLNDSEKGAGWHDAYNVDIYIYQAEADTELANEIAWQHIEERLTYMFETDGYFLDFMRRKFTSQWNAPLYLILPMNNHLVEEAEGLVKYVYFEDENGIVDAIGNMHQIMIYAGTLLFILVAFFSKKLEDVKMERYTLLICIIGGAMFSMLWEAKARYTFPYYMFMIPYAAVGISEFYAFISYYLYKIYTKVLIKRKASDSL